jgi:hypothetical protein
MRFVDRPEERPESKLNQMIAKIAEKHHEYAELTYTNKDGTGSRARARADRLLAGRLR